jgi:myotubularin-related protein 1/2
VQEKLKEQTVSLWSYTNSQLDLYKNPLYWANNNQQRVLIPIASIRHIKLWKAYYCRWNPSMRTQDPVYQRIRELLVLKEQLEHTAEECRKEQQSRIARSNVTPA